MPDVLDIAFKRKVLSLKARELELEGKLAAYKKDNLIEFFDPQEYQAQAFDFIDKGKKTVVLSGANRIGKTVFGAVMTGSECLGDKRTWDGKRTLFGGRPIRVRILCRDWEHHAAEVIVPKLKEWFPKGSYDTKKNNVGVEGMWFFKNTKSTLELVTSKMDPSQLEGWAGHVVWIDEPTPKEHYDALVRGLVDHGGICIITLTDLGTEPWLVDALFTNPAQHIGVIEGIPMNANTTLSADAIQQFSDSLSPEMREVRVHGKRMYLQGLVHKMFDREMHLVEPFDIPQQYTRYVAIDTHPRKEHALLFMAIDKGDRKFVYDEKWSHGTPEDIADWVLAHHRYHPIEAAVIEAAAKGDSNRGETTYSIIEEALSKHGIGVHVGSKDVSSGVQMVNEALFSRNNMPSLFMFRTCERTIWEIQRYIWDRDGERPKAVDNDMMENMRRLIQLPVEYVDSAWLRKALKDASIGYKPLDAVAGY